MILSTSTNLLCERPDGTMYPLEDTLRVCSKAGFNTFDMSFYEWSYPGMPFLGETWREWIDGIAELKDQLGISFYQSHAYTYDFLNPRFEPASERAYYENLVFRSLECCRILDCKVVVVHPSMDPAVKECSEECWKKNIPYLERYLEYADKYGMELAVENMYQYSGNTKDLFFADPQEIAVLIDSYGDSRMGVCWDFEHGVILKQDQPQAVRILDKRLKATHVSDTASDELEPYMHILPFSGMLDWKPIMNALTEIRYEGAFSFEAHNFAKKLPEELLTTAMKFAWEIGDYLTNTLTK